MAVIWYWLISQLNDLLDVWLYNIITVPIEYKSKYYLNKDLHYHVFVFSSWHDTDSNNITIGANYS
jgi:hypothetical protein